MIWALHNSIRSEAAPGLKGQCEGCGGEVRAKCGSILMWHWAHVSSECDPWYEPESSWHLAWKKKFPKQWQEVVVGGHRADIKTPANLVIELQASRIPPEAIAAREAHYRSMIWILRGDDFSENFEVFEKDGYFSFRWKRPRKSWWHAKSPVVVDLAGKLFQIKKMHSQVPCWGWGIWISENHLYRLVGYRQEVEDPTYYQA